MFLGMQDFDFAWISPKSNQFYPKFAPNLPIGPNVINFTRQNVPSSYVTDAYN